MGNFIAPELETFLSMDQIPGALLTERVKKMKDVVQTLNDAGLRKTRLYPNLAASLKTTKGEPQCIRRAKALVYHLEHVETPIYEAEQLIGCIFRSRHQSDNGQVHERISGRFPSTLRASGLSRSEFQLNREVLLEDASLLRCILRNRQKSLLSQAGVFYCHCLLESQPNAFRARHAVAPIVGATQIMDACAELKANPTPPLAPSSPARQPSFDHVVVHAADGPVEVSVPPDFPLYVPLVPKRFLLSIFAVCGIFSQ